MNHCKRLVLSLSAALLLAGSAGKPAIKVRGRLLENGRPLIVSTIHLPPGDKGIQVSFYPLREGDLPGDPYQAVVSPGDGSFEVLGPSGRGIPPGRYRVTIRVGVPGRGDHLKDAFNIENTPIVREVSGDKEVVIDVGKEQ